MGKLKLSSLNISNFDFGPYVLEIKRKKIKHIYFRVYHSKAKIVVSAPVHVGDADLVRALDAKAGWIKKQTEKESLRKNRPAVDPIDKDKVCLWGKALAVDLVHEQGRGKVLGHNDKKIFLKLPLETEFARQNAVVSVWLRSQLQKQIYELVEKWEPTIGVKVHEARIRRMRTRWGSCNISKHRIWISFVLVHLPQEFLEYVIIHEMTHLLERYHNKRFKEYMDLFVPDWRNLKRQLNTFSLAG